ncbi:DNA-directed RNA polymerase, beta' subunit [Treponema primitia ZAS-2]|uniref:DNA-directed RNA polymerase subunit beta' n=1 Tax=Treponema primitia (strain ATCC BAA-887 / DSM 12427 / ZAS-2) TaxID=545694 RepID=F5YI67_TREPZ|nr:DNA-directed RNA polymerase subunit beta' [Treponema primitia]AEF85897.1 DNA-directed RNA polymerase, beta' subunit [Treponema primitia ZAS-2]
MRDIQDFDSIMIKLASPEMIRAWSYGEVKKPETINYRTLRPEKDGLFCERIFGTTKEWECYCGKFKSIRYKGVICDRCGVEVTHFKVRRERMGHIELAAPVSHIWYYRSVPSRMGLLLDLPLAALRSVLYYEKYVVIDSGDTDLKKNQLLTEEEYYEAQDRYGQGFSAGMGAEAVRTLLENLNLDQMAIDLRAKMIEKGAKSDKRLLKRIDIVENFRNSTNKPEWMILDVIPVIPPELRPMVQLDGGRFATSDLNDLYRRVINRNNRLKRLQTLNAPDIIIRNEKRMLQEAVDALFDNSKKKRVVKGASNRPLKSISDMLKGKQGRFRQNLLGKRVDYSGRSVITVGPDLKMWQCGLPTKMALELFKPFIMKKLVDKDVVYNIKKAKMLVEQETPEVFAILDEVVKEHPVLLNRAPTLHRLGIQAFEPVLVEGKAIKLHPLVCHAFNADFDGDQMAVHVPLTQAAQMECWTLMLSARNLLNPANGKTIVFPSQDMVLGINFLTRIRPNSKGWGRRYSSTEEILMAVEAKSLDWEALIKVKAPKLPIWDKVGRLAPAGDDRFIETTAGRLVFNEEMPPEIPFINYELKDKELRSLIEYVFAENGSWTTVKMLDVIKATGYKYATVFGATIGVDDILVPKEKPEMIEKANKEVDAIQRQWKAGHITQQERYDRVVDVWNKTNEDLTDTMMKTLEADHDGFNSIYMMANSGARGSRNQIRQLAGMRGLMAKPSGQIIELPIRSNFKEGLSVIEFFISTNGARKGLADTALKTAEAGYLTRRLVDIAQDVVVNDDDCGTINGISYSAIKDGEDIVEPLSDRIVGRYTLERVKHPITGEMIIDVNEEITEAIAEAIEKAGVESVRIRTVLTCEAKHGVCRRCYGRNLATNRSVDIGEAVGTIAAQSIGQPGTQLTMRTFHIGGAATKISEENRTFLKYPVYIRDVVGVHVELESGRWLFSRKGHATVNKVMKEYKLESGDKLLAENGKRVTQDAPIIKRSGKDILSPVIAYALVLGEGAEKTLYLIGQDQKIEIRNGSEFMVAKGTVVEAEKTIATFDPFSDPIIAEASGYVNYEDILPGTTLKEELDEETGNTEKRITEYQLESKQPRIFITDDDGNEVASYFLPGGAYIQVDEWVTPPDNQEGKPEERTKIKAGRIIAKTLKESAKAMDITSGLPRVSELFEARKPKSPTVLAQVSGTVYFKGIVKGKRVVTIADDFGKEYKHLIPMTKRLQVRDGDTVEAGEPLCVGAKNPHDVLHILGESTLQRYLMDEIQQVYRLQGVSINDKHIGVIIRQMMRKVEIVAVGDTKFIFGAMVDKYQFHEENARVLSEGGQPAVARPMFQGITKASLNIESFLSAASFQETTRVLTNAAIAGKTDYLRGLKENIIIGHPIPAGTGMKRYRAVKLFDEEQQDLDVQMQEILEQRKLEKVAEPEEEEDFSPDAEDSEE